MKKSKRRVNVVVIALLLTVTSWLLPVDFMMAESEATTKLKNPVIVKDSSMEAGQKVTWDCIWFGSYPQSEVVCETDTGRINELKNDYYENKYITVSSSTWNKITSADYSDSGDATIDGVKYRRLERPKYASVGRSDHYNWGDETVLYFKHEPIKWRVLNIDGNDAFLLADKALDRQLYNILDSSVTWETCTMRSWLNGYDSSNNLYGRDYTKENFINTAFSSSERKDIKTTNVVNDDNVKFEIDGGNDTCDKIFLLSDDEVCYSNHAVSYGFTKDDIVEDEGRRCQATSYLKAMGIYSDTSNGYAGGCFWLLRSPGSGSSSTPARVYYGGGVWLNHCITVTSNDSGMRPALHLNISSSNLWSYAGTVSSDGTVVEPSKETNTINGASSFNKTYGDSAFSLNATAKTALSYSSSNTSIATVSSKGVVTIKKAGTVTINIKAAATSSYTAASKQVTIYISKASQNITCDVKNTVNKSFGASAFSLGAKSKTGRTYTTSNSNIAKVSSDGKVTLKNPGKAVITITAPEGTNYKKATKKITVNVALKKPSLTVKTKKTNGKRKATLTWTKPYGAQGYELYTYVPSSKSGKKTYIKSGNKKTAKISGFKKKTTYKYKIRAYRTVNGKKVYSPYTSYKKIYFSK